MSLSMLMFASLLEVAKASLVTPSSRQSKLHYFVFIIM